MLEKAEKQLKNAKISLIVIGILTIGVSIYYYIDEIQDIYATGIDSFIGLIFIALALWVNKKPYLAVLIGLILFVSIIILTAVMDPNTLSKGWLLRIVIIVVLFNGLKAAKQAQELRHELGLLDEDPDAPFDQIN